MDIIWCVDGRMDAGVICKGMVCIEGFEGRVDTPTLREKGVGVEMKCVHDMKKINPSGCELLAPSFFSVVGARC